MGSTGKLSGKVAIVTASSDGIGLAIARRLLHDGAKVMISSRKQQNVDRALAELKNEGLTNVTGSVCHVSKADDRTKMIQQTLSEFGGIDILVSNAATNPFFGPIFDITESVWDKIMETNVKASMFLCKEICPYIEKRGGGTVILVSSQAAYTPSEFMGPYAVSKTALLGLTKALVPQLAKMKIRVNCIAPGVVKTKFAEALWKNDSISETVLNQTPLRRFGEVSDVSGVVSFLVSNDSAFITGETITIAGGVPNRL